MTLQEAAEVLALSQGALKSRMHRARTMVAEDIREVSRVQIRALSQTAYTMSNMRNVTRNER